MRRMTFKAILQIAALILLGGVTVAQRLDSQASGSGVYLNESDFMKNKITLFSHNDDVNYLECLLDEVVLTRAGKKYKMNHGTVFGYYQDGASYRYYRDNTKSYGYYKVLEASDVVVYSRTVSSPKTGSHVWYYYSETLNSPLKRISGKSLKHVPAEIYPVLAKYLLINSGKNFVPNS